LSTLIRAQAPSMLSCYQYLTPQGVEHRYPEKMKVSEWGLPISDAARR